MRSLFVMDPLDRIQVQGDSTYMLMLESSRRGFQVSMCTPNDLHLRDGEVYGQLVSVQTTREAPFFHVQPRREQALAEFDLVWMRKDPPYDMAYVFTTWLLDRVPAPTRVINHPYGLKLFNEKLFASSFSTYHPSELISRDLVEIRRFVEQMDGKVVLKPWSGNGGRGVLVTEAGDRNLGSMIELLTAEGREFIIAQQYIPGIIRGDKRILLFDGQPVAAFLRVPSSRDHRGNMHVGATVAACELSDRDRDICAAVGPELHRWGQTFVGIDVIDGYLTEINVTSPTGIQEANRLYGLQLEADLIDRAHQLVEQDGAKIPALR